MQINDATRQKIHETLCGLNVKTLYIADNPKGHFFPVSTYFPELSMIIIAMLINATDERPQTLTVEFKDCTACTSLNSSKRLENSGKTCSNCGWLMKTVEDCGLSDNDGYFDNNGNKCPDWIERTT